MDRLILAIDQGTTSTRAIAFSVSPEGGFTVVGVSQIELAQHFPQSGWVEHDAAEIWSATLETCRAVIAGAGGIALFAAIGITNQRETAVMWDTATGEPLHRAVVWQDRRTADVTAHLTAEGHEPRVQAATGLILDPYFSATKFAWLLDAVPGARERAARGEVKLGTIESWLIWKLTGGARHVTDATNASRTSLMDLTTREWRDDLCALFRVPREALPEIHGCSAHFGDCDPALFGAALPIHGAAGDQQSALVGHWAMNPGDAKITYGTGAFLVPGFTGLGAPWWEPDARGTITGLTRDSGPAHFVRAALEALAYQTRDLLDALVADGAPPLAVLRVDGGVTANGFAMQFVADICEVTVERPALQEMTALGAARLAALGIGLIDDLGAPASEAPTVWTPKMGKEERIQAIKGWQSAVRAAIIAAQ